MKRMHSVLFAAVFGVLAHGAATAATLGYCTPSPNCSDPAKPCYAVIQHSVSKDLPLNPAPVGYASVIRVRLCTAVDGLCGGANATQAVTVHGFVGNTEVYTKTLKSFAPNPLLDTGPYTELPRLTRMSASCGNAGSGFNCRIVWQHCRALLPESGP